MDPFVNDLNKENYDPELQAFSPKKLQNMKRYKVLKSLLLRNNSINSPKSDNDNSLNSPIAAHNNTLIDNNSRVIENNSRTIDNNSRTIDNNNAIDSTLIGSSSRVVGNNRMIDSATINNSAVAAIENMNNTATEEGAYSNALSEDDTLNENGSSSLNAALDKDEYVTLRFVDETRRKFGL